MSFYGLRRQLFHFSIILLLLISVSGLFANEALSKTLYSYSDETGTRVITDNYNNIPPLYRSRVTAIEQEGDQSDGSSSHANNGVGSLVSSQKGFVINVPGMSFEQSKVITYAGFIALLCILAMNLSRSEGIRVLALWCLLMTGICAPVLVYIADDGAGTIMKKKAAEFQQKEKERLSQIP